MSNLADRLEYQRRLPGPVVRRAIRESAGITQQDIAAELGVHRMSVARWEAGDHKPRGDRLRQYVEILEQLSEARS